MRARAKKREGMVILGERGGKGGRGGTPLECYTCKNWGLPCDHWLCALVRRLAKERYQSPQRNGKGK